MDSPATDGFCLADPTRTWWPVAIAGPWGSPPLWGAPRAPELGISPQQLSFSGNRQ